MPPPRPDIEFIIPLVVSRRKNDPAKSRGQILTLKRSCTLSMPFVYRDQDPTEVTVVEIHTIPLFAEAYTAYGKHTFYREWIRHADQLVVIDADDVATSALLQAVIPLLSTPVIWTFAPANNPQWLSGVLLPIDRIAIVSHAWLSYLGRQRPGQLCDFVSIPRYSPKSHPISRHVYRHLFMAKEHLIDLENLYRTMPALSHRLQSLEKMLVRELTRNRVPPGTGSRVYHAFRSTLTPYGPFVLNQGYTADGIRRTLIMGPPGSGIKQLLKRVGSHATYQGHQIILLHCGLDPIQIDHIYLPDLSWLISNNTAPHCMSPMPQDNVINLYHDLEKDLTYHPKIEKIYYLYTQAYQHAWDELWPARIVPNGQVDSSTLGPWIDKVLTLGTLHPVLRI